MIDQLIGAINQLGYGYFFFIILVGANLTPIPDPVYIMLAGSQATSPSVQYIPAFILTYSGMMLSLYLKFLIASLFSAQALALLKRPRWEKNVMKVERTIQEYGFHAIIASYFLPGMRHVMPFFLGASGMKHRHYIKVSFSFGFIWTLALFIFGSFFNTTSSYTDVIEITLAFCAISLIIYAVQRRKIRKKQQ